MANVTYDQLWKEAMVELLDQLEVNEPAAFDASVPQDDEQRVQHYATLYVRYLQIVRKLEEAYDQIVHPQKRVDIKATLVAVMGRVLEIKEALIALNRGINFLNLDEVLVDLKLGPEVLEVPVPRYFVEEREDLEMREKLLDTYTLQFNLRDRSRGDEDAKAEEMTLENAIRAIQINERARQGRQRSKGMREIQLEEERERRLMQLGGDPNEKDPDSAALVISARWRGYDARKKTDIMRREEFIFIGMEHPPALDASRDPLVALARNRQRRKHVQRAHAEEYKQALVSLKDEVASHEAPEMREEMLDQLRDWYIKEHERTGAFPKLEQLTQEPVVEEVPLDDKAKKAKEKADKEKAAKAAKAAKAKKGKGVEEDAPPVDRHFAEGMESSFRLWSDKWQLRDESSNFAQRFDPELVKQQVRPEVEEAVREEVRLRIEQELENLEEAFERDRNKGKKKKKGKGKKGKGKKGKGKKAKGKKGKPKGPKEPKDIASKTLDQLYRDLVHKEIAQKHPKVHVSDFVGSFLYLGRAMEKLADAAEKLPPPEEGVAAPDPPKRPDPAVPQIRQAITESCIWPLGEQELKNHWSGVKSLLLVGTKGSGKRMLAHAIATETGANFFDLTPSNTNGKYPGKKGPYEMLFATLKLAKAYQPSVVWIGDVDTVFKSGKGKKGAKAAGDPPNRILKPLKELVDHKSEKKRLLAHTDRVLIVGATAAPHNVDKSKDYNAMMTFFKKVVFLPLPDYPSRYVQWEEALKRAGIPRPPANDVQTLARISEHYTSGSIMRVVRRSITQRRVDRLDRKPFSMNELIAPLAKEMPIYHQEDKALYDWYIKSLGLDVKPAEVDPKAKGKKGKDAPKKK